MSDSFLAAEPAIARTYALMITEEPKRQSGTSIRLPSSLSALNGLNSIFSII
jgi:hypothetical protein